MIPYDLVQTDAALRALIEHLGNAGRLAVDLEGENNLHAYGIRVCLLQFFDGERGYLVDPLAIGSKSLLKELFESAGWLAVMFDSANDLLALQHDLGTRPRSLCDLAVAANLLGLRGGLHAHLGASSAIGASSALGAAAAPSAPPLSARAKDRFQKSNWLRRPFSKSMLDYALSDVTGLLDLADSMIAELERRGLRDEFERRNRAALEKERTWDPLSNYTRIPGFGRMSREKRQRAKVLWYAREYYARGSDLPPEAVASKPQLTAIVERGLAAAEQIASFLNEGRKRNPVDGPRLSRVLAEAERDAAADSRRG